MIIAMISHFTHRWVTRTRLEYTMTIVLHSYFHHLSSQDVAI